MCALLLSVERSSEESKGWSLSSEAFFRKEEVPKYVPQVLSKYALYRAMRLLDKSFSAASPDHTTLRLNLCKKRIKSIASSRRLFENFQRK